MKVKYSSNNSGGSWWLEDKDWHALEAAGWTVLWEANKDRDALFNRNGRFLGALAREAIKEFETPAHAMREFEKITGQDVTDEGCNCCGAPHGFLWGKAADPASDKPYEYASGEGCIKYLYGDDVPTTLREAIEKGLKK